MKINIGKNDICYTCQFGDKTVCDAKKSDINYDSKKQCYKACRLYKKRRKRFVKPTVAEIEMYAKEKGYTNVDAQKFYDHFESVGWVVGKSKKPMVKWKSAVSNWNRQGNEWQSQQQTNDDENEITYENIETSRNIYPNIDWDSYEEEDFKLKRNDSKIGKGVVFLSLVQSEILLDEMDDINIYNYYIEMLADFIIKKDAKPKSHFQTIMKWYKSNFKI